MTSLFHSIRWQVQAWHALILLLVIAAFCVTAHQLLWDNQLRRIDKELSVTERTVVRGLMRAAETAANGGVPPPAGNPPSLKPSEFIEHLGRLSLPADVASRFEGSEPGYVYYTLHHADGRILQQSPNAPPGIVTLPAPAADIVEEARTVEHRREFARSSYHGLCGVIGRDITPELEERRRFAWSLAAFGLGIWALGLIGGWWISGRAIRPIQTISETASRIAEGNLLERISTDGARSELNQLSTVLNQTFERLQASFERQKQFTSDASHELRTPVTILLSETQRILKRQRTPEEYREALQTCGQTAQRMRHLIEALLLLARQEGSASQAHWEPCDLATLLRDTISHLLPLAAEKHVTLHCDLQPAPCTGDASALAIVAANLMTNAIQHLHPQGHITVSCGTGQGQVTFSVKDDGPGISAEDLPHIFERFYRADKARTQTEAHSGLGLAIAQTIVENHHGTLQVESTAGQGATFTVTLPAPGNVRT